MRNQQGLEEERGWTKLQTSWIKVNTDAAPNSNNNKAGWGVVTRKW